MEQETLTYQQILNLFKESSLEIKELRESQKETDRKFQDTDRKFKETEKLVKQVSKDIGHLGNKFGRFNEALVIPSLEKLFREKFYCKKIAPNYKFFMNGDSFEIDMYGIAEDSLYVIEIKSKYSKDDLEQLNDQLEKVRRYEKEYQDRAIFGVIVATDYDKNNVKELYRKGIYFISISDDLVKLDLPENFQPKKW